MKVKVSSPPPPTTSPSPPPPSPPTEPAPADTKPSSTIPHEVPSTTDRQSSGFSDEYIQTLNHVLDQQSLASVLEWCYNSLPNFFQITSFGATGMVIIHELQKLNFQVPVIFLDTLYHFEETLEHARAVGKKYNLQVHWYSCPKAKNREEFEKVYNSNDMWISHPRRFEYLTKVEPLERALSELKVGAWITGRRRDQGGLRTQLPILEIDVDGRIKVNPLAHWSREEVWDYLSREGVPYNPLFDQSYASVGDTVTTSKTDAKNGERSGRFYQFGGTKTECGIHVRKVSDIDHKLNSNSNSNSTTENSKNSNSNPTTNPTDSNTNSAGLSLQLGDMKL